MSEYDAQAGTAYLLPRLPGWILEQVRGGERGKLKGCEDNRWEEWQLTKFGRKSTPQLQRAESTAFFNS